MDEAVQRLADAANRNDIEAFLAGFTADGIVDDWGREFHGAEGIRHWSDREFIGKQVSLHVDSTRAQGPNVTVKATVGGNGFNGPSTFTFHVTGDKVSRMTIRA